MPIRTIDDKHYKGISELYRKSDGKVTGYYVTYRDAEGKPVKRRVAADNRDEALRQLVDIRKTVDQQKREKTMSALPNTPAKRPKAAVAATPPTLRTMQECQKIISAYKERATVLLIDIVAFDDISILYGYETAGRVVLEVETLIASTMETLEAEGAFSVHGFASLDFELYHLYADRFCLFVKNDFSHRLLDRIADRVQACVAQYRFVVQPGNIIHLNITIGATKADSSVSLMYAEKALQEAKRLHNSYIFYDSRSVEQNGHLFNKTYETLIDNIRFEKVTPHFQGIFSADELSSPVKFESLMRLVDKEGHILSPGGFLEHSREYRLYTQMMSLMMERVFEVLERYDVAVTLNLSFTDISNAQLCERLLDRIEASGVGSRLTVEIVESDQIRDIELVNEFIFMLKKQGVLIAIDDFGSGFSNFDNLLNLEVDYVKLDGSLISKLHERKHRIILANMVNICHELGIKTIGEYISDTGLLRIARSIGIDYLQGHYLHKPQSWELAAKTFGYGEVDHAS